LGLWGSEGAGHETWRGKGETGDWERGRVGDGEGRAGDERSTLNF
jgi:hypothetical protein